MIKPRMVYWSGVVLTAAGGAQWDSNPLMSVLVAIAGLLLMFAEVEK